MVSRRMYLRPLLATGLGLGLAASLTAKEGDPGFQWLGLRAGTLFFDPPENMGFATPLGAQGGMVFQGRRYGFSLDGFHYQTRSSLDPSVNLRHRGASASFLSGLSHESAGAFWPYLGVGLGILSVPEVTPLTHIQTSSSATVAHASLGFLQRSGSGLIWGLEGRVIYRFPVKTLQEIQATFLLGYTWGGGAPASPATPSRAAAAPPPATSPDSPAAASVTSSPSASLGQNPAPSPGKARPLAGRTSSPAPVTETASVPLPAASAPAPLPVAPAPASPAPLAEIPPVPITEPSPRLPVAVPTAPVPATSQAVERGEAPAMTSPVSRPAPAAESAAAPLPVASEPASLAPVPATPVAPATEPAPERLVSPATSRVEALRRGDLPKALELSRAHVEELPIRHWTLRLEVASLTVTLKNAAGAFPGSKPDLFVAPIQLRDGRTANQLFLGDYASREAAAQAAKTVPAYFLQRRQQPIPFLVSDIPARACPMAKPVPRPAPPTTPAPKGITARSTPSCSRCH